MRTLYHGSAERIISPQFGFGKRNNDNGIGFHAYSKLYLTSAKKSLGRMLDFACNELKFEAGEFWDMFMRSGVADRFGSGESRLLAGMSGVELAYEVLDRSGARYRRVREPACSPDKSPEYWAGWALAHYQWMRNLAFAEISNIVSIEDVIAMYDPYHEMDISHFVDELDRLYRGVHPDTNLKKARLRAGLSQGELAAASGVSVRTIQELEQRRKDINKAQLDTVVPIAAALYCSVESLIERVP